MIRKIEIILMFIVASLFPNLSYLLCGRYEPLNKYELQDNVINLDNLYDGISHPKVLSPRKINIGVYQGSCGFCGTNITSHGRFLEMYG